MIKFEVLLRSVLHEAALVSDQETVSVIARMLLALAEGDYAAVRSLHGTLRPIYRNRLGEPPTGREGDPGSKVGT